jgi:hypothetical protein
MCLWPWRRRLAALDGERSPYVTIPIGFWSYGWLLHLSPVAIAVLFSLREHLGGYKVPRYLLRDRRESYRLSHDTWTRGRHELEDSGLHTVTRVPQGDEYVYNRLRNNYWLNIDRSGTPAISSACACRGFRPGQ